MTSRIIALIFTHDTSGKHCLSEANVGSASKFWKTKQKQRILNFPLFRRQTLHVRNILDLSNPFFFKLFIHCF